MYVSFLLLLGLAAQIQFLQQQQNTKRKIDVCMRVQVRLFQVQFHISNLKRFNSIFSSTNGVCMCANRMTHIQTCTRPLDTYNTGTSYKIHTIKVSLLNRHQIKFKEEEENYKKRQSKLLLQNQREGERWKGETFEPLLLFWLFLCLFILLLFPCIHHDTKVHIEFDI